MKHQKLSSSTWTLIIGIAILFLTINAFCSDITVSNIKTLVVEKGNENYSVSVQANVTNLGESGNILVTLTALDMSGYQIKDVILNGHIEKGKTRVLKALIQIPKQSYEDIFKWEWKLNK